MSKEIKERLCYACHNVVEFIEFSPHMEVNYSMKYKNRESDCVTGFKLLICPHCKTVKFDNDIYYQGYGAEGTGTVDEFIKIKESDE